jgi:lipid-A-disaccharide synthase
VTTASRELHVFLVAGEESGDRLGAALMRAIKTMAAGGVLFSGVGGRQMVEEGLVSATTSAPTAIIGFAAIPARVIQYWRLIRETAAAVLRGDPDVMVIIDSPEFTHRVAKSVRRARRSIPIVNYGAPSVWAWRPGRARAMRSYIDHVMALLPFEPAAYERLHGPPCTFVGHPAAQHVAAVRPNEDEARRRMASPPVMLVMPGSRPGEITRMLGLFKDAVESIAAARSEVEFVIPTVPALADTLKTEVAQWRATTRVVTEPHERDAAIRIARLALVKSGTSTLEVALAGVPMVTTYQVAPVEAFVARRVLNISSVILVNLVLGEDVVPEFLQEDATVANVVAAAMPLFEDGPERRRQLEAFARLDTVMEVGGEPASQRAAAIVLKHARQ